MTTQEAIEILKSCANSEIPCHMCDFYCGRADCMEVMMSAVIDHLEQLESQLAIVTTERNKAVEFIKYLDKEYSGYMSEEKRFSEWRVLGNGESDV